MGRGNLAVDDSRWLEPPFRKEPKPQEYCSGCGFPFDCTDTIAVFEVVENGQKVKKHVHKYDPDCWMTAFDAKETGLDEMNEEG